MNCFAAILLFCEGPKNSFFLLNHSDQKENQSQSQSKWSQLGSFTLVSFDFSQVSSDKHILSNWSLLLS